MSSQKYTGIFQSDFDPAHKTLRKEKIARKKVIKKDAKKNKKYKSKEQYISTVSH